MGTSQRPVAARGEHGKHRRTRLNTYTRLEAHLHTLRITGLKIKAELCVSLLTTLQTTLLRSSHAWKAGSSRNAPSGNAPSRERAVWERALSRERALPRERAPSGMCSLGNAPPRERPLSGTRPLGTPAPSGMRPLGNAPSRDADPGGSTEPRRPRGPDVLCTFWLRAVCSLSKQVSLAADGGALVQTPV